MKEARMGFDAAFVGEEHKTERVGFRHGIQR